MAFRKEMPKDVKERIDSMNSCSFALSAGFRVLRMDKEEVRLSMEVGDKLNALGTVHGGAIFSIADQAFALAANQGEHPQVAMNASIHYLRPARGTLEAVATRVEENRQTSLYRVEVYDGDDLVALFHGVGYKLKR